MIIVNQNVTTANTSPPPPTPSPAKKPNKLLVIAISMFLLGGLGGYLIGINKVSLPYDKKPNGVACTMEALICPDGSSVGRTGPNCEFAPCPRSNQNQTETENLKVYKSETGLYEISIPSNWSAGEHPHEFGGPIYISPLNPIRSDYVQLKNSAGEAIHDTIEALEGKDVDENYTFITNETTQTNIKGNNITRDKGIVTSKTYVNIQGIRTIINTTSKSVTFILFNAEHTQVYDQILSSFKFLGE